MKKPRAGVDRSSVRPIESKKFMFGHVLSGCGWIDIDIFVCVHAVSHLSPDIGLVQILEEREQSENMVKVGLLLRIRLRVPWQNSIISRLSISRSKIDLMKIGGVDVPLVPCRRKAEDQQIVSPTVGDVIDRPFIVSVVQFLVQY